MPVTIGPAANTLDDWRRIWRGIDFVLAPEAAQRIDSGAEAVENIIASGKPVYGINTGFGKLATEIPHSFASRAAMRSNGKPRIGAPALVQPMSK